MLYKAAHYHYHIIRLSELRRLYWAHSIKQLANSLVLLFIPIYLYKLNYSVPQIMGYFLMGALFWAVILYPVLRFSNRIGFNRSMGLGLVVQGVHILLLASIGRFHWPLGLIAFIDALATSLYWVQFRASFAHSLLHKKVGPIVGTSAALSLLACGVAPALGGAIATEFGITALYVLSIFCFVAAAIPLLSGRESIRNAPFKLRELSLRRTWRDLVANFSDNTDDSVLNTVWPLFIFLIIPTYVGVGILSSITVLASILIALYIGHRERTRGTARYIRRGTTVVSFTNAMRLFVQSTVNIAGVNFLNGLGHALLSTSYVSNYYKNADREPLLPYVYAMIAVSALSNVVLFGILFLASLVLSLKTVLAIGLLIGIPAGYAIRLIRS